jgi:hypothetical protein
MFTLSRLTTFIVEPLFWLMLWLAFALTLLSLPRWRTVAVRALWAGFLLLILLGFEVFPNLLLRALEKQYPIPTAEQVAQHEGVIILGGVIHADLYTAHGQFALNEAAERLTQPMALARQHPHLKLLYSSGEAPMVRAFFEEQGVDMKRVLFESRARSVPEVAHAREHHGHAALVGGGDDLVVAHRAAGLGHAGGTCVHHHVKAVAEREEGVAGDRLPCSCRPAFRP